MKTLLLALCFFLINCVNHGNDINTEKIDNLITFAKAYGYVKYFHPSDEAANIDWNSFAAYGAEEILKCTDQDEVVATLDKLFHPIAPSVVFSKEKIDYDFSIITPDNIENYKTTFWQHNGVSVGMNNQSGVYRSVRVNRNSKIDESSGFGNLIMSFDADKYLGKEIKYTGWAKVKPQTKGTGHLWMRIDKENRKNCFFNNMDDRPIKSTEWQKYELTGEVCEDATKVVLGGFMKGQGTLYLDDVHLYFRKKDEWIEIPIENNNRMANK